jgi:phage tail-like protein
VTSYEQYRDDEEDFVPNISPRHPTHGRAADKAAALRFRITLGSEVVGFFQECSGFQVEYETLEWPEGGQNSFIHKLRGRAKYQNLVLKGGITNEKRLIDWFRKCANKTERANVTVELLAADLKPVRTFAFANGYPVKWTGPNMNASQNNVAIETLEIAHEGFAEV